MDSGGDTLNGVTISSGSTVTVPNNQTTTLQGTITITATAKLFDDSNGNNNTDIELSGSVTLTGGGSLTMSNAGPNRVYGITANAALLNDVNNTIQGSGQFGLGSGGNAFALTNDGTIDANQSNALTVNPGGATANDGTIEATNTDPLNLGGIFNNRSIGIIQGAGGTVNLGSSTINAGTLMTSGGGAMNSGGDRLNGVTISSGSTVTVPNNQTTTLQGTITIAPTGVLFDDSNGNNLSDIELSGSVTLTGGGSLTMSNTTNNRIYGITSNAALLNDISNTIQGSGQVGINDGTGNSFTLTNNGTIDANQSNHLQIAPTSTVVNTNTLEATGGGTLNLGGTFTNTGGTIQATGANSVVNLGGTAASTITGGTLTVSNSGFMSSAATTLNSLTISSGSTVTVPNNQATALQGTITIAPTGVLFDDSNGNNNSDIELSGSVTLTGGGSLTMSNTTNNRIYGITASAALLNDVSNTIQGSGQFGLGSGGNAFVLTNDGTMDANQSNALTVNPGTDHQQRRTRSNQHWHARPWGHFQQQRHRDYSGRRRHGQPGQLHDQ